MHSFNSVNFSHGKLPIYYLVDSTNKNLHFQIENKIKQAERLLLTSRDPLQAFVFEFLISSTINCKLQVQRNMNMNERVSKQIQINSFISHKLSDSK